MKNIDPLTLPAYRFYNLALTSLRENRTDESLEMLETSLRACDVIQHPVKELINPSRIVRVMTKKSSTQESQPQERQQYVPPWWKGEEGAYQVAMMARKGIGSLPKMG